MAEALRRDRHEVMCFGLVFRVAAGIDWLRMVFGIAIVTGKSGD
jgi:hypothetical protein